MTFCRRVDYVEEEAPSLLLSFEERGHVNEIDQRLPSHLPQQSVIGFHFQSFCIQAAALQKSPPSLVFVAARPISLSEQIDSTRSLDYPFTVIVLRLDETGRGNGLFVPAAKLSIGDNQQLEVESLGIASNYPIRSVKAQP